MNLPTIPHNREAEENVIGSVLINPEMFNILQGVITKDDFYIVRNQWMWETFTGLMAEGMPIDFTTVSSRLDGAGRLLEIGGLGYLTSLLSVPTSLHAEAYAKMVHRESFRRKALQMANRVAALALSDDPTEDELSAGIIVEANTLGTSASFGRVVEIGKGVSDLYDIARDAAARHVPPTLPTGFYDLDRNILHGLSKQKLYIVATRPGLGKSTLVLDMARHAAIARNKWVGIYSLEMSYQEMTSRVVAAEHNMVSEDIMLGKLSEDDWVKCAEALEAAPSWKMYIDDTPAAAIETIYSRAKVMKSKGMLDLLIVDYIQLMRVLGGDKTHNRQQEVGIMSRTLKMLARELDIPVVAAAQVNRMSETRTDNRIRMSDLRESGDIEQDADVVILLQPPDDAQPLTRPIIDVEVTKNRGGRTGTVQLLFEKRIPSFLNMNGGAGRDWWNA